MKNLTALLMLIPILASADPEPWMKKENPNEIHVASIFSAGCPASSGEAEDVVSGVLARSRLKMVHADPSTNRGMPWLVMFLSCGSDQVICTANIDFVGQDKDGFRFRHGITGYTVTGNCNGQKQILLTSLRDGVEAAITDYLRANFDLDE